MAKDRRNVVPRNAADYEVQALEPRRLLSRTLGPTAQSIEQPQAIAAFPTINGQGESIAVLDTGIDYNHPLLGGGFGPGFKVVAGYDFVLNDGNPLDPDGHGTGVGGVIAADEFKLGRGYYEGVAPDANLIALRIDDSVDNPGPAIINEALHWVLRHQQRYNIVAVNISEGDNNIYTQKTSGPESTLLSELNAAGVFVAVSAGNDSNSSGVEYPAADPDVAAVGAADGDQVASFSDAGDPLDLLAPGVNVPTTYTDNITGNPVTLDASGTSFASPFAAGAAALVHQADPSLTPDQILTVLKTTGTPIFDPSNGQTYPLINLYASLVTATHLEHMAHVRHAEAKEMKAAQESSASSSDEATMLNELYEIRHKKQD